MHVDAPAVRARRGASSDHGALLGAPPAGGAGFRHSDVWSPFTVRIDTALPCARSSVRVWASGVDCAEPVHERAQAPGERAREVQCFRRRERC